MVQWRTLEQAGPVAGVARRSWRSPVVRCDWESEPFVPHKVTPYEHPIATLGTDMEAMQRRMRIARRCWRGWVRVDSVFTLVECKCREMLFLISGLGGGNWLS